MCLIGWFFLSFSVPVSLPPFIYPSLGLPLSLPRFPSSLSSPSPPSPPLSPNAPSCPIGCVHDLLHEPSPFPGTPRNRTAGVDPWPGPDWSCHPGVLPCLFTPGERVLVAESPPPPPPPHPFYISLFLASFLQVLNPLCIFYPPFLLFACHAWRSEGQARQG